MVKKRNGSYRTRPIRCRWLQSREHVHWRYIGTVDQQTLDELITALHPPLTTICVLATGKTQRYPPRWVRLGGSISPHGKGFCKTSCQFYGHLHTKIEIEEVELYSTRAHYFRTPSEKEETSSKLKEILLKINEVRHGQLKNEYFIRSYRPRPTIKRWH